MKPILLLILLFNFNQNPPGTIEINGILIDKTELTNRGWKEYVFFRSQEPGFVKTENLLPDSSNIWYPHLDHNYEPIVLVSYEQVLAYCAWRSRVVSENMGKKVTYRLPTQKEWEGIADELVNTNYKRVEKDLKKMRRLIQKNSAQYFLMSMEKPKSRVYHMFDNVSEMTLEKGIAIGSNNSDLAASKGDFKKLIEYDNPSKYIGFRCIAEIE